MRSAIIMHIVGSALSFVKNNEQRTIIRKKSYLLLNNSKILFNSETFIQRPNHIQMNTSIIWPICNISQHHCYSASAKTRLVETSMFAPCLNSCIIFNILNRQRQLSGPIEMLQQNHVLWTDSKNLRRVKHIGQRTIGYMLTYNNVHKEMEYTYTQPYIHCTMQKRCNQMLQPSLPLYNDWKFENISYEAIKLQKLIKTLSSEKNTIKLNDKIAES